MTESRCIYCLATGEEHPIPSLHDDSAWDDLSLQHAPGCEWIETRAFRR